MRRTLSSLQTVLVKPILPVIWIFVGSIQTIAMFLGPVPSRNAAPVWFLLLFVAGGCGIIWESIRMKWVSVDSHYLYVSNYLKEISIPLSEICNVTENRWLNSHPVTIHLRSSSDFGDKIVFMPKVRFFGFYSSHPVVRELKGLASSRGAKLNC
jgi:hypothetical protein